jgi:protease YdgD
MIRWVGFILALFAAAPAMAQPIPHSAIGVVVRGEGFCTGSVVAPRVVLTAAHCLFRSDGSAYDAVRFRLAGGRNEAREVLRAVAPGFDPKTFRGLARGDPNDWALIRLDRDLNGAGILEVRALTPGEVNAMIRNGGTVTIVGYGRRNGEGAHVFASCRIQQLGNGATWAHRCGTGPGDSGSPNLIVENGRYVLVGIESRYVTGGDGVVSAAAFAGAIASVR